VAPELRTVLIAMKPDPSVGMSANVSTLIVKPVQEPAGSTTFTVAPMPAGAPVGGLTKIMPAGFDAVIVTIVRIGTPVCTLPVSGFVQLVVPSHCIDVPVNEVNVMVWNEESSPAEGNAPDAVPQ